MMAHFHNLIISNYWRSYATGLIHINCKSSIVWLCCIMDDYLWYQFEVSYYHLVWQYWVVSIVLHVPISFLAVIHHRIRTYSNKVLTTSLPTLTWYLKKKCIHMYALHKLKQKNLAKKWMKLPIQSFPRFLTHIPSFPKLITNNRRSLLWKQIIELCIAAYVSYLILMAKQFGIQWCHWIPN